MAEGRQTSAWLNASRMSKRPYLFVEGVTDEWFWNKFIDRKIIQLQQVKGWENVVETVREFNREGLEAFCIGIIDRDFESLHPHKGILERNVFLSDLHDIEMMMYQSPAWVEALPALDKKNTVSDTPSEVLNTALFFTDRIGYLKLVSLKSNLGLLFKNRKKDGKIELPDYEKFVMDKKGMFTNDAELIRYIIEYSKSISKQPQNIPSQTHISDRLKEESGNTYDSFHLSNGHDLTYIIKWMLKRKYKNDTDVGMIEACLLSAYSFEYLKSSRLYTSLHDWVTANNIPIFRKHSSE